MTSQFTHRLNRPFVQIIVALVGGLLPAIVAAVVQLDLHSKGPSPKHHVVVERSSISNPSAALALFGERISVSIGIDGEPVQALRIGRLTISNQGQAPIEPQHFHKPLTCSTSAPWRIAAIESPGSKLDIALKWHRASDVSFEAEPFLFNSGDRASITAYLVTDALEAQLPKPELDLDVRVTNLKELSEPRPINAEGFLRGWGPIIVLLSGPRLFVYIAAFLLFFGMYVYLLSNGPYADGSVWRRVTTYSGLAFIALSAAEPVSGYLYPYPARLFSTELHWLNAVCILAHVVATTVLFRASDDHKDLLRNARASDSLSSLSTTESTHVAQSLELPSGHVADGASNGSPDTLESNVATSLPPTSPEQASQD